MPACRIAAYKGSMIDDAIWRYVATDEFERRCVALFQRLESEKLTDAQAAEIVGVPREALIELAQTVFNAELAVILEQRGLPQTAH